MNDKFFDLKKEKQDRMINAALKIFALNGYAHASTDDIVKEAEISKGLLFHYFTNKIGLYSFIYDFSVKFYNVELTSTVDKSDNDFFSLHLQLKNVDTQVMKTYPYMLAFLYSTKDETVLEAIKALSETKDSVEEKKEDYFKYADTEALKSQTDMKKLNRIIDYVSESILHEAMRSRSFRPEDYYEKIKDYLVFLKEISYK